MSDRFGVDVPAEGAGLIYVMGPSGAGKDTLLGRLRAMLPPHAPLHIARRSLTRAVQPGGEAHEHVAEAEMDGLLATRELALYWEANGCRYGIRSEELAPLAQGRWVVVNGSRGHWATLHAAAPKALGVLVQADPEVLAQRLARRGREDGAAMALRLQRATSLGAPPGCALVLDNSGPIERCAERFLSWWHSLPVRVPAAALGRPQ
ncbi:AAA family ATPase [Caldimonas brevitalea]|uniref:Ribose 1,5-bisphosphokinase n=1 Tax=Caldimonas brevitalea TaxID=413882 RepID=A0A0G3BV35_9BURK|nr:AAA family ATPase [Caldimonas brevitalea]AKJ30390.1 ribose 1,5-bisphosphokinase [Caldimonas brevitalea]